MEQNNLIWIKNFGIKPSDEIFDLIVFFYKGDFGDSYFGILIHFQLNKTKQSPTLEMKPNFIPITKCTFTDRNEEGIIKQFKDWLKINLKGEKYDVVQRYKTTYIQ
jgi:hypothetical protein